MMQRSHSIKRMHRMVQPCRRCLFNLFIRSIRMTESCGNAMAAQPCNQFQRSFPFGRKRELANKARVALLPFCYP
ncbi:hypothetical protein D3C72_2443320 [compost metagenome]